MAAVLKLKSSGSDVKKVQKLLNKKLKLKLTEDGKFGPAVEEAVREYQKKNKLKVDGKVGPRTLGHLTGQGSNGSSGGGGGAGGGSGSKQAKELTAQCRKALEASQSVQKLLERLNSQLGKAKTDNDLVAVDLFKIPKDLERDMRTLSSSCRALQDASHKAASSLLE